MTIQRPIKPSIQLGSATAALLNSRKPRRDFPVWHFAMVNDHPRNAIIERAISHLDLKGKTVVEIGTGTGLVALLFARHGAARVITCEMNENLATVAQKVIANTEYADRITVVNESSTVAIARGLLPRNPDVIFTETLDCGVVGEGFMPIAQDIAELAGQHTVIMPVRVEQTGRLVSSESIAEMNRASVSCGFDLSVLNEFSTGNYFPVHTELHEHTFLSDRHHLRTYRYLNCPTAQPVPIRVSESGIAHGVVSWFTADFGDAHISNEPFSGSHWHQAYHPLPQEMILAEGDAIHLLIDDDGFAMVTR